LIATSSPAPIGAMTTSPRPSIALAVPLRAFLDVHARPGRAIARGVGHGFAGVWLNSSAA